MFFRRSNKMATVNCFLSTADFVESITSNNAVADSFGFEKFDVFCCIFLWLLATNWQTFERHDVQYWFRLVVAVVIICCFAFEDWKDRSSFISIFLERYHILEAQFTTVDKRWEILVFSIRTTFGGKIIMGQWTRVENNNEVFLRVTNHTGQAEKNLLGPAGIRTRDLRFTSPMLYQLSYRSSWELVIKWWYLGYLIFVP